MEEFMRRRNQLGGMLLLIGLLTPVYSQRRTSWKDPSQHKIRFVTIDDNVRLEVLDWGGHGRPVILLAGGGNTAHIFDEFAPKLTANNHVYGITRRGFGAAGFAASENAINRLRDDVLAVIGALKLKRPVLVGHSIAGAELSAVANSHPDIVAGLVYLEAGYPYAFENGEVPSMQDFQTSNSGPRTPSQPRAPSQKEPDFATFSALQQWDTAVHGFRRPEAELRQTWDSDSSDRPRRARDFPGLQLFAAILTSPTKYARIPVPALVIFALPHVPENNAVLDALTDRQAKALERSVPTARVVRLRGAHHIFLSNEQDVLREMRTFLAGLK
jgi:pimeloyl-ACP methyl ester carboxylesterase